MIQSSAVFSACGRYRYSLSRRWGAGPVAVFIMLNPSTADAEVNDPTIRRCIGFARREGCGGLDVVNLFAWRASLPRDIPDDPKLAAGPRNAARLRALMRTAQGPVIAAWGADPRAGRAASAVLKLATDLGIALHALKLTRTGAPGHPLYVRKDAPLVSFPSAECPEPGRG